MNDCHGTSMGEATMSILSLNGPLSILWKFQPLLRINACILEHSAESRAARCRWNSGAAT